MKIKSKKSIYATEAAWLLSIITAVVSILAVFIFAHLFELIGLGGETLSLLAYLIYGIIVVMSCFLICKNHPQSIWYSLIICNITGIFPATGEQNFWSSKLWVLFVGIWALSIIVGIIGMRVGIRKRKSI